jgi:hypothetical protein
MSSNAYGAAGREREGGEADRRRREVWAQAARATVGHPREGRGLMRPSKSALRASLVMSVGYFGLTSVNRRTEDMGERSTSPQTRIRPDINKARLP